MRPIRRHGPSWLAVAVLIALLGAAPARAADVADPNQPLKVYWYNGRIVVEVQPQPNEGYIQIARRVMEEPDRYPEVVAFNAKRPVMTGRPVVFPLVLLKPELRGQALRTFYPDDELTERGWAHTVTDPLESLIQLTEAYTGSKGHFRELARLNRLKNPDVLRLGTEILIPLPWIPEGMGFRPVTVKPPLAVLKDERSGHMYATYTLRKNDTLYSLLIRFTDRERADEINRMSRLLLELNGFRALDRVPAGNTVRIPIEWISEDYLVNGFVAKRSAPPPRPATKPAHAFQTLHVIVDAGHGGVDPGAVYGRRGAGDRVYEHEVVYDISLRLLDLLRAKGYQVYPTVLDPGQQKPVEALRVKALGPEEVLVNPPYKMSSAKVSVNMRVFLINALYRHLTESKGIQPENILLVSIHGDALAPTLRGSMVYYPDSRLRVPEFNPSGRVYRLREEAAPRLIRFDPQENEVAEDMSQEFAQLIVKAFRSQGLGVSPRKPVRPYYYRQGERTLPAVLRYSPVPTSVLLEVANLNNRQDRLALLKGVNRQRVARGLATAVDFYRNRQAQQILSRKSS